ncbi:MAG: hypothetical protein IJK89_09325 [Clostridia bacterium]|nr:hypothetical protein [Clostridia bacterium]
MKRETIDELNALLKPYRAVKAVSRINRISGAVKTLSALAVFGLLAWEAFTIAKTIPGR